jgi:hypothetical protein
MYGLAISDQRYTFSVQVSENCSSLVFWLNHVAEPVAEV